MALPRGRDMVMVRPHLNDLPESPLPPGYVLEPWRDGDEEEWLRIHLLADHYNDFNAETFRREYGVDDREWARRILFLRAEGGATVGTAGGATVGTAGAWTGLKKKNDESWGQLHWVAIVPGHQGRGLARPLISAALLRMRELGHARAFLETNSVRPTAIRLYEEFGFADVP